MSALTNSMSISVWTPFTETKAMHQVTKSALPFRASWSRQKLQAAGWIYIRELLHTVLNKSVYTAEEFVKEVVLNQRFRYMLIILGLPPINSSAGLCILLYQF